MQVQAPGGVVSKVYYYLVPTPGNGPDEEYQDPHSPPVHCSAHPPVCPPYAPYTQLHNDILYAKYEVPNVDYNTVAVINPPYSSSPSTNDTSRASDNIINVSNSSLTSYDKII